MITLPGAVESMTQMVALHGGVGVTVLVTQWSLGIPRGRLVLLDVTRACPRGGRLLGPGPEEVADSGLVPRRSLAQVFSSRSHWLNLFWQRLLA